MKSVYAIYSSGAVILQNNSNENEIIAIAIQDGCDVCELLLFCAC